MVKQPAAHWLGHYADENRLFYCTEVSALYLMVLDAYAKGLPSSAGVKDPRGSQLKGRGSRSSGNSYNPSVRSGGFREGSSENLAIKSAQAASIRKSATLPSQIPDASKR
jgi:hypothetical protein